MAEYIKKKDLLKVLPPKCNMSDMYATAYNTCLNTIENLIKEHPTADVVPVVRCKDCKYYKPQTISVHWHSTKKYCCRGIAVKVNDNDYCSYGERKDSND